MVRVYYRDRKIGMQIETAQGRAFTLQVAAFRSDYYPPTWATTRALSHLPEPRRTNLHRGVVANARQHFESTRRVVQGGSEMDVMEAWAGKLAEWALEIQENEYS